MGRKGQAAIEFLTTYGWMVVAVAVLGGTTYTTLSSGCELSVSGATGGFPQTSKIGQYANQTVVMEVENPQEKSVTVETINFSKDGDVVASVDVNKDINGKASKAVSTNRFKNTESCQTYSASINYSTESLSNLESTFKVSGPVKIE